MTGTTHILVVDDEPDIRETLQDYLELHGYRVTQADGGEALRAVIAEEAADLVLLDINMPGEDGLSLARFLREQTSIPVVMLTASGEVVDRIVGLEMGADDYLTKPVDLRELLARVKAVLQRRLRQAAPRSRCPQAVRWRRQRSAADQYGVRSAQGLRRAPQSGPEPRPALGYGP
jgi:two-component system phosphate regulon response regulator OmpR